MSYLVMDSCLFYFFSITFSKERCIFDLIFCPINAILASFDVLLSETNLEESVDLSAGSQTGFEESVVRIPFLGPHPFSVASSS